MELHGRVVVVTGAGKRVGQAIAISLGAAGMRVAAHYHGSEAGARETVETIERGGGVARSHSADLTSVAAAQRLIGDVVRDWGGIDVLVNSAAVMERTPLSEVTVEQWDAIFALNLRAPFFLSQA